MITIGLTGGIGSGKSTIAKMFRELDVPVYDSDIEAKILMTTSPQLKREITSLLGEAAYKEGELDRTYIASKVFSDQNILKKLNAIVHPAVREHFEQWRGLQNAPYVIQETALIFENGMEDYYDYVILVKAPVELRLKRVMERDGVEESDVRKRMDQQVSDILKIDKANFIIENRDLGNSRNKVSQLHNILTRLSTS
jgi:dephospho-CoA kinase